VRKSVFVPLLIAAVGLAACDDDDPTGPEQETFTATLTGAAERPNPVTTDATGTATLVFNPSTSTFSYTLNVSNITAMTGAHIHGPASVNEPAGILVPLTTPTGASVTGTFTSITGVTLSTFLSHLRGGMTYVNVHTEANGAGEIRGQLTQQ